MAEKRQAFNVQFYGSYRCSWSPRFYFKGTIGCNFAGIFIHFLSAPAFITQHLKLDAQSFTIYPSLWSEAPWSLAANRSAGRMTK